MQVADRRIREPLGTTRDMYDCDLFVSATRTYLHVGWLA